LRQGWHKTNTGKRTSYIALYLNLNQPDYILMFFFLEISRSLTKRHSHGKCHSMRQHKERRSLKNEGLWFWPPLSSTCSVSIYPCIRDSTARVQQHLKIKHQVRRLISSRLAHSFFQVRLHIFLTLLTINGYHGPMETSIRSSCKCVAWDCSNGRAIHIFT
jgi:hypothetical protein